MLDLPEPTSTPEAWDVIRQSVANVQKLLETRQLKPVAFQIANISPAVRALQADLQKQRGQASLIAQLEATYAAGGNVITATRDRDRAIEKAQEAYDVYRGLWDQIGKGFSDEVRASVVYHCPMHPLDRHLKSSDRCTICGMKLVIRRIPSSTAYEAPGRATISLHASTTQPLRPEQLADVLVTLQKRNGSAVTPADLLVMHTQRIHLLIVDSSLGDYHHEHPVPTEHPGEFRFAFTPRRPGPYRIFADLVPAETAVQEFVMSDLPGEASGQSLIEKTDTRVSEVDGVRCELAFGAKSVRAKEVIAGSLQFRHSSGADLKTLEPVMGAFAHIVGFHEDRKSVVHLHPQGTEPTKAESRGGPRLSFNFYASEPGFYRLYVQIAVEGRPLFLPFNVNVAQALTR